RSADVYPGPLSQPVIEVTDARIERVLGLPIKPGEAAGILERLDFAVTARNGTLQVRPPEFRLDCAIPEDVVEEVGRIYGYDRVPSTLPGARTPIRDLYDRRDADETAREVLAGRELDEAVTGAIVSAAAAPVIALPIAARSLVQIKNPM